MKARLLLFVAAMQCAVAAGAQTVGIEECFERAEAHYPLAKQRGLAEQEARVEAENIAKTLLPQAVLNLRASYQSDVVSVPLDLPGLPKISKDQYKATLDLTQTLWDGGVAKALTRIATLEGEIESLGIDVELYRLRDRIAGLYLGVLLLDEQVGQTDLLTANLETSLKTAEAMQANGVAALSDIDVLKVEILNARQKKIETEGTRDAYLSMLSAAVGVALSVAMLRKPAPAVPNESETPKADRRPETVLFARQTAMLDAREKLTDAKNTPKFNLFVQGGYGKPGLNMLADKFDFFALGGVGITWNFGGLYTRANEKRIIGIGREKIRNRAETLEFDINRQAAGVLREMSSYAGMLEGDREIILLREKVRQAAERKYNNGVYTVNELVKDINAENLARLTLAVHETMYLMKLYTYKILMNV
ncbi:MAG: TolC family protein [Prevotellaceae bacterium]|jgi:outer membrane protein TolC|nr:TolC family protein [Prevotellaceae bacterium]